MKKAFTLVELMVVVMVMALLMMIVFRLGQVASGTSERSVTIDRLQRLENCLSGYYAAFGSYPPVKLHGSRNIYYKVNDYGIQQVKEDPDESQIVWSRVEAACRSQPVAMNYPYDKDMWEYIKKVSQILTQRHNNGEKGFENPALANLFDALENPSQLGGKQDKPDWTETQLFRFGLMSFLLPRYLIMMRHDGIGFESMSSADLNIYDDFKQWGNNNQMPCRFEDGSPYDDWKGLAGEDKWKVALLPSQAVCARWLPNLEGDVLTCDQNLTFYGVNIKCTNPTICPDNPNPPLFSSGDSQSGEGSSGSQQYVLAGITCRDGFSPDLNGQDFYYYSLPPYQSYRLWSAGPNKKTFPPWIPEEELNRMNDIDRKNALEWVSDDIVRMKN